MASRNSARSGVVEDLMIEPGVLPRKIAQFMSGVCILSYWQRLSRWSRSAP